MQKQEKRAHIIETKKNKNKNDVSRPILGRLKSNFAWRPHSQPPENEINNNLTEKIKLKNFPFWGFAVY